MFFLFTFENKEEKIFADLKKKFAGFQEFNFFYKIKNLSNTFFSIFIIHKPSLWSRDVPQKIWARSVRPFSRLLDTNEQTDTQTPRQAKFIYIDIYFYPTI